MKKILLVSSAGGHYSELKKIKRYDKYEYVVVVEKTNATLNNCEQIKYYMHYGTRKHILKYMYIFLKNIILTWKILKQEKPDVIITTGAHTAVGFIYLAKLFAIPTIYIESYAKVSTKSLTYKLIKRVVTLTIIQHQELQSIYPEAKYYGGMY